MSSLLSDKLQSIFKCKLCWQLSISLFITILIAESIILIPFYLSFRSAQYDAFNKEQIQIAKMLLTNYTTGVETKENTLLMKFSDIKGLTIYSTNGTILKSYGKKPMLSPVDFKSIKPISKEFYRKDAQHFYTFWDQSELSAPYDIVGVIDNSHLKSILHQFIKTYWDEALILLIVITLSTLILSYFWLLRPIRSAYLVLSETTDETSEFKIKKRPNNELGYIFKTINKVFNKLAKLILELRNSSMAIKKLNEELETKVTARTKELAASNKELKTMALLPEENINPVFRANAKGEILYHNPACADLFEFWQCKEGLVLPKNWAKMINSILISQQHKQVEITLEDKVYVLELVPIPMEGYVNIYGLDVTEKKLAEQENKFLQNYDHITKLYNKRAFKLLLDEKIKQEPAGFSFSLWFIQANDIVSINQNLGHSVGDEFLKNIALLLEKNRPEHSILSHFNQNIFALVMFSETNIDQLDNSASQLLTLFNQAFTVNNYKLHTACNIGIALYPNDASSIESLFKAADMALLQSITKGSNHFHFYTDAINKKVSAHHKVYQGLHTAVLNNELVLFYQPQLHLKTHTIIGVEALIRWQHPQHGLIPPDSFVDVLEKSALIFEVTPWLLETVAAQLQTWQQQGINHLNVAINLSLKQLLQVNLIPILKNTLTKFSIPAHRITLEITERAGLTEPETCIKVLKQIQSLGFSIALDDFGTDYSSLNFLQQLPLNKLKLDKSFLDNLEHTTSAQNIVKTIIQLARTLQLTTIGEGVETESQLRLLEAFGCDEIQGYFIAKPLPANELLAFLQQYR